VRTYEVTFIFRSEEDLFKKGLEFVKSEFARYGATVQKEEDMGDRTLAYPIKKQARGHYTMFVVDFPQDKIVELDKLLKLQTEILKFLFIVSEV